MRIIAIIPARAGSKRIKDKNLSIVGSVSLIEWTMHDALNSNLISDVYVSTDSHRIKEIAMHHNVTPIDRPEMLCSDESSSEEAIENVLSKIEPPDIIVMMQCTSPFRTKGIIDKGINILIKSNADSLFYGCPVDRFLWTRENEPLNYDYKNRPRTQNKEFDLIECGDYIFTYNHFLKTKCRLGGKIVHCLVDKFASIDIDTSYDLIIANSLAKEIGLGFNK